MDGTTAITPGLTELLVRHLGQGRMTDDAMAQLAELDRLCPDSCRGGATQTLWRAITVSTTDHDRILKGEAIALTPRSHDCWSRSMPAILHLLRVRSGQDPERPVCLMLRRDFNAEDIAVDVEAVARHCGLDLPGAGGVSWHVCAGTEQEVLVRNPEGPIRIRPEDVAIAWRDDALDELWKPFPGEPFLDYDYETRYVETFEGTDDCGCSMVKADGRLFRIIPLESGWSPGAAPDPEPDMMHL